MESTRKPMTQEQRERVDSSSYEQLLEHWRNGPIGDDYFHGECGEYYSQTMFKKKALMSPEEQVAASKRVGWGIV